MTKDEEINRNTKAVPAPDIYSGESLFDRSGRICCLHLMLSLIHIFKTEEKEKFKAKLVQIAGKDAELHTKEETDRVVQDLLKKPADIISVTKSKKQRKAKPPVSYTHLIVKKTPDIFERKLTDTSPDNRSCLGM